MILLSLKKSKICRGQFEHRCQHLNTKGSSREKSLICHRRLITVRNETAKVMFLQVSVCPQSGAVPGPVGGSLLPGGCLVQEGAWSRGGVHGPGGGVGIPACTEAEETATAAHGTHPTGMHSC